jgi:ribosomal protein S6
MKKERKIHHLVVYLVTHPARKKERTTHYRTSCGLIRYMDIDYKDRVTEDKAFATCKKCNPVKKSGVIP